MPVRRKRIARKPKRRAPIRRRRAQPSGALSVKHYARIVEVVPFTEPVANQDYNYAFSISLFDRALQVSRNFKYYRAKRVVWTLIPQYNTYNATTATTLSLPQVSFIMNRTGDNTIWTAAEYDAQGAVPTTFAKKRVVAYKPNLVQPLQVRLATLSALPTLANMGSTPLYDKWIPTNVFNIDIPPSGVAPALAQANETAMYYGHSMLFTQLNTTVQNSLGSLFCEVEWEFKDPLFVNTNPPTEQALPPACSPDSSVL